MIEVQVKYETAFNGVEKCNSTMFNKDMIKYYKDNLNQALLTWACRHDVTKVIIRLVEEESLPCGCRTFERGAILKVCFENSLDAVHFKMVWG